MDLWRESVRLDIPNHVPNHAALLQELNALEIIGAVVLTSDTPVPKRKPKYYHRVEHEVWPFVHELAARSIELASLVAKEV